MFSKVSPDMVHMTSVCNMAMKISLEPGIILFFCVILLANRDLHKSDLDSLFSQFQEISFVSCLLGIRDYVCVEGACWYSNS